jgi:hypothetical protein
MTLHRRDVLIAGAAPWLAGCATDVWQYREAPVAELATRLGVCAAVYATLKVGQPLPSIGVLTVLSNAQVSPEDRAAAA